jgi:hypothetical protein
MKQHTVSVLMVLFIFLASYVTGCNEPDESSGDEGGVSTLFSCSASADAYQNLVVNREDYLMRDALEQMARTHFDTSCLAECELSGDMIACTSGSCPTFDGGTVEYESFTTWDVFYEPDEGSELTRLTITIDNPEGAELQHFELVAETTYTSGLEDDDHALDLTVTWVGSIGEEFPVDGSLTYSYSGSTFDGCFRRQNITSETGGCHFDVEVTPETFDDCYESCSYTVTLENGDEMTVTNDCPPFRQ